MRGAPSSASVTPTAYELYFSAAPAYGVDLDDREDRFFHSIRLRNGTRKTTWHHRLNDLNAYVQRLLPPDRPLDILDVAVSSGVSTAEWRDSLRLAGISCRMVAGDAVVEAFLVSIGHLRALVDRTGYLMQLDMAGRAVRVPPPRRRDRIRYAPLLWMMRVAARLVLRGRLAGGKGIPTVSGPEADRGFTGAFGIQVRPLKLVSSALARASDIETVEDDILHDTGALKGSGRRFHVVRAANILNRAYFDTATLERMLTNLRGRLRPGGLLIVCRTSDAGVNNASVFTLEEDGRLRILATLNEGSEVAGIVMSMPASGSPAAGGGERPRDGDGPCVAGASSNAALGRL